MKKHDRRVGRRRSRTWALVTVAVAAVVGIVAGVIAMSGTSGRGASPASASGTPRLVVDRDTIDLGRFAFNAPARAVFTVSNSGNGPLEVTDALRVRAVQGC